MHILGAIFFLTLYARHISNVSFLDGKNYPENGSDKIKPHKVSSYSQNYINSMLNIKYVFDGLQCLDMFKIHSFSPSFIKI